MLVGRQPEPDAGFDRSEGSVWWRTAVVYQVYPRSFADASGDGVGDLRGLIGKLDHLAWLGVDALWISPIFRSPMADFGYDVSDFCDVDPLFGTVADVDELIAAAHLRGIRILLDWVPNHTSDQHAWFQESRRDRTNPKAGWYVWRDAPANNWRAALTTGEPAWEWDPGRGQYYLRTFLRQQPDLDWDNPDVEAAMLDTLRFWLDRGVDGFRMDVVHLIGKDIGRDDPQSAIDRGHDHVIHNDVAVTHERLRRIRTLLDSYPGQRTSVGEVYLLDEARMAEYYGHDDELHMSFNFRFLWAPLDAAVLRERIRATLSHLVPRGAWPTWVLSNHDVPRHRQRYGGSEAAARIAAVMLLTLPGTPFIYQGEELGLVDAFVPLDRVVDPGGRDGCRAPIPWTAETDHGWPAEPWLPFPPDPETHNVASELADPASMLHFYHRLLQLRRGTSALHDGSFELVEGSDGLLEYERSAGRESWIVYVNPGHSVQHDGGRSQGATIVIATEPALEGTHIGNELPPQVAYIARRA
jgi:alpha-glucosidase